MHIPETLNVSKQCRRYGVGLWKCPQFLFIIVGFFIIFSMIILFTAARHYEVDPAIAVVAVSTVAAVFFIVGQIIVSSFERVAESSRAQAEFVSVISHQLRTPLTAIRWQVGVLKNRIRQKKENVSSLVDTISDETVRATKLVSSLLEVGRIEQERMIVGNEKVSLARLTRHVVEEYEVFAGALKINLSFNPESEDDEYEVSGDATKLEWVIENLVENAVRYSKKGGHIKVSIKRKNNSVLWEISDEGIGIPKDMRKKIFRKFFRASNAIHLQTEGTGLGLFIARSFIEAMGGKINFVSEESKGSTFHFNIPAYAETEQEHSEQ